MILDLALFWFVLLGSKLLLGAVVLYMLLPRDRACAVCDAELLPLAAPRRLRRVMRYAQLQMLWCVECDRQLLGRRRDDLPVMASGSPLPVSKVRVR